MSSADLILGLSAIGLQVWIAAILFVKKEHRQFPLFTAYTVYSITASLVRFILLKGSPRTFFFVFWATEPLYAVLGLLAIYESFKKIFRPLQGIWWFRLLFYGVIFVPLVLVTRRFLYKPPLEANQLGAAILALETGVRYVQACVFAFSATLIYLFHLPARRYPACIVDGFGVASVGILLGSMFRSEFGIRFNFFFSYAPSVSYIVALLIWLATLRGPEKRNDEAAQVPMTPEEMRDRLRRYLTEAKKISRHKRK
jgi:hypothetical protein